MAEIRRVSTPPTGRISVTRQADNTMRPSSGGAVTRQAPSEGLISLSPEPGQVKFEDTALARPNSGRASSAGHTERKLLMARKKEELLNESDLQMFKRHASESSLTKEMESLTISKKPISSDENKVTDQKELPTKAESSSESSESDSSSEESDGEDRQDEAKEDKVQAPVELKGDFLGAVMDEDFEKAKELCQKILLLEPDNATCMEFHAVIAEKIKQDEAEDESSGSETDDSADSDETDEEEEGEDDGEDDDEGDDDDEDISDDSDDDYTPPTGPINLIMGGLPILPQSGTSQR